MGQVGGVLFCDRCQQSVPLAAFIYADEDASTPWICDECRNAAAQTSFVIHHHCPNCAQALAFSTDGALRTVRCPRCKIAVRIPIQLPCPQCGKRLSVPLAHAGQRITCRHCGRSMRAPQVARPPESPVPPPRREWTATDTAKAMWADVAPLPPQTDEREDDRIWHFFSTVAGVSHENRDGSSRQDLITRCRPLEQLDLVLEPDNPYDPNAVMVCRKNGDQLGYLPAGLAAATAARMDEGYGYAAWIMNITDREDDMDDDHANNNGADDEEWYRGLNILILVASPEVPDNEVQNYLDAITPMMRREADPG